MRPISLLRKLTGNTNTGDWDGSESDANRFEMQQASFGWVCSKGTALPVAVMVMWLGMSQLLMVSHASALQQGLDLLIQVASPSHEQPAVQSIRSIQEASRKPNSEAFEPQFNFNN